MDQVTELRLKHLEDVIKEIKDSQKELISSFDKKIEAGNHKMDGHDKTLNFYKNYFVIANFLLLFFGFGGSVLYGKLLTANKEIADLSKQVDTLSTTVNFANHYLDSLTKNAEVKYAAYVNRARDTLVKSIKNRFMDSLHENISRIHIKEEYLGPQTLDALESSDKSWLFPPNVYCSGIKIEIGKDGKLRCSSKWKRLTISY